MNNYKFIIRTVLDATGLNQFKRALKVLTFAQDKNTKAVKRTNVGTREYGRAIRKGNLLLRTTTKLMYDTEKGFLRLTSVQKRTTKGWITLAGTTRTTAASFSMFNRELSKTTAGLIGAARRALVVIPVWLALRGAMMSVITSIREGVKHIIDFNKALARAEAVAAPTTKNIGAFMDELKVKVLSLARETGVSADKITELFYRMGTAGLSAEEGIGGMEIALKTSIAIMGDATETAKVLADIYNLMGDRMIGVKTPTEKMQKIGATMAILWKDNAFTLDEFTSAMKTFVPTAKTFNLSLDEMLGLTASAATLMSRGAGAGTQMSRAFIQLTQNAEAVENILGRTVNFQTVDQFSLLLQVLIKLNGQLKKGDNIGTQIRTIFGAKGARTIGAFASSIEVVLKNLTKLTGTDLTERIAQWTELFDLANKTLQVQIDRFGELKRQAFEAFVTGVTGTDNMISALEKVNKYMEEKIIPSFRLFGELLGSIGKGKTLGINVRGIQGLVAQRAGFTSIADAEAKESTKEKNIFGIGILEQSDLLQKIKADAKDIVKLLAQTDTFDVEARINILREQFGDKRTKQLVTELGITDRLAYAEGISLGFYQDKESVIENINDGLKTAAELELERLTAEKERQLTTKQQLVYADYMIAQGYSELEIALEKLRISELQGKNAEERLKVAQLIVKQINKEALALKSTIQGGIKDVLLGEGDVSDIFAGIGERIKDSITDALAENLTEEIFKATGLGTIFGEFMFGLKNEADNMRDKEIEGHRTGAEIIYNRIIQAHIDGAAQMTTDAPGGAAGAGGGLGGLFGGLFSKQLIKPTISSKEAVMTGLDGTPLDIEGRPTTAKFGVFSGGGITVGGAAGAIGGAMALADLYKLKGSGDALGGLIQGATAGAALGSLAGPIGAAVGAALGAAFGLYQATQSKTTEEISQTTKEIASKIKVTNNQLQVVNRNLVALRRELAFILPESAYFSESRNLTDNFSLHSRRGLV